MLTQGLFDVQVCAIEWDLAEPAPEPMKEEQVAISGAVKKRKHEFAAGRACARTAMRALGHPESAVPMGGDRVPIWPPALVGSITHSQSRCAAALALRSAGYVSIGLDIEPLEPLDVMLVEDLCTPSERRWLERQSRTSRGYWLRALFCAKECAYKAQYAITHRLIGFQDVAIAFHAVENVFSAHFQIELDGLERRPVPGRLRTGYGHVAAGIAIRNLH